MATDTPTSENAPWRDDGARCPRCDAGLITNGRHVWCSFVRCTYGLGSLDPQGGGFVERDA